MASASPVASTSTSVASSPSLRASSPASSVSAESEAMAAFDVSTIDVVNASLSSATPQEILAWAIAHLPNLWQTTAFGLTGLAATDMIAKITKRQKASQHLVPMIFIDTLYHFEETLALADKVERKYKLKMSVFRPPGVETTAEFEEKYGQELWKTDEDTYDYLVKVEPARRAYEELNVKAVITGRRRSQGADRATLQPLEVDSTGLIKVNPLCRWGFSEVKDYIDMAGVPYNPLLDQGYKSVGDWHSTKIPVDGEGERAGRWSGNTQKTECGLHKDYFKMKKAYEKKRREAELASQDKARGEDVVGETSVQMDLLALN
ncbi:BQ2448_4107 [Microbotryum intermedium]|uniref:BQ2448_4107 protein n=1 Tax=Microbotryum intermedium TaxID=269621 RepID=A0A238FFI7_9BASI|nr:BQ2448_4107 [Microbotryum intermedium]